MSRRHAETRRLLVKEWSLGGRDKIERPLGGDRHPSSARGWFLVLAAILGQDIGFDPWRPAIRPHFRSITLVVVAPEPLVLELVLHGVHGGDKVDVVEVDIHLLALFLGSLLLPVAASTCAASSA